MGTDIPVTYVPARNTIFLSLAMGWAETLNSGDIFIGAHSLVTRDIADHKVAYGIPAVARGDVGDRTKSSAVTGH